MNIGIVTYGFGGPGGIETITAALASELSDAGIGVFVVSSQIIHPPDGMTIIEVPS